VVSVGMDSLMPASLFVNQPQTCPFDHELTPGTYQVGFMPCACAVAVEASERGWSLGHMTLLCRACESAGRVSLYHEPPHDMRNPGQPGGWQ
jgi:hypothetical protein